MKKILFVMLICSVAFAKMGDCFTCHPKLIKGIDKDKSHHPMLTCIKCHKPNKTKALKCGVRCFSCHTPEDMEESEVKAHKIFGDCRECHVKKVKEALNPLLDIGQSHQDLFR